MKLLDGKVFKQVQSDEVIDYLKSRKEEVIEAFTRDMVIIKRDNQVVLLFKSNNRSSMYPIRTAFLYKLLKWYNISHHSIHHFLDDTLILMCNDNLREISKYSKYVNLKIENNEVVSIVSKKFTLSSDLDVINIVQKQLEIADISRDDFCMRIITKIESEAEPIVGDISGFGLNITNSETGFSTLKAEHYILRYWCSNGCTTKIKQDAINIVHYNIDKEIIYNNLANVLEAAPKEPEFFTAGVKQSLTEEANLSFPQIEYKVNSIIGSAAGYNFFDGFDKKSTKYDLFNHITHTAKKFNIMQRYKLESLGGSLIC